MCSGNIHCLLKRIIFKYLGWSLNAIKILEIGRPVDSSCDI